MKISNKTAKRITNGGLVVAVGSAVMTMYFLGKSIYDFHSPYDDRLREIDRELPVLQHEVAECMPATATSPSQKCLDFKVRYEAFKQESKEIKNSEGYKAVEAQIENDAKNSLYSLGLFVSALGLVIGEAMYNLRGMNKDLQKLRKETSQQ